MHPGLDGYQFWRDLHNDLSLDAENHGLGLAFFCHNKTLAVLRDVHKDLPELGPGKESGQAHA